MNGDIFWAHTSVCVPDILSSWFSQPGILSLNQENKCWKDISIWNHAHNETKLIVSKLKADTLVHKQIVLTHFIKAVQMLKNFNL